MEPRYSIGLDVHVNTRGKRIEKLHYMHANPVKRGLVSHPKDWTWSSWAFCWNASRCGRVRSWKVKEKKLLPKTQVSKPNLGHPPCFCDSRDVFVATFRANRNSEQSVPALMRWANI
jgi:hypothetical protein